MLPIDSPDNLFHDGNSATAELGTILSAAWLNAVQAELLSIIQAAGLAPADGNQILTALRSAGVFQTPPQFNATTKAATMAAVQRALGSYSGIVAESASRALTAADVGVMHGVTAAGITLTLPDLAALPDGAAVHFKATTATGFFTVSSGGPNIIIGASGASTSINIDVGEDATLIKFGTGWALTGGTLLRRLPSFAASLTGNGYQKLPSGLILQWGTGNSATTDTLSSFNITFPNACLNLTVSDRSTITMESFSCEIVSPSQFKTKASSGSPGFYWMAIGY